MTDCIKTELQITEIELFFAKAEIACLPQRTEFVGRAAAHIDAALKRLARLTNKLEFTISTAEDA